MTRERIDWLKAYGKPLKNNSLSGSWDDSDGGQMQIFQDGKKLYFSISVVRGPSGHTGDIKGVATWNSPRAFFSDKGFEPDKDDETTLTFTLEKATLEVAESNSLYYRGAHAYFEGSYLCIRPLTDKEKADLINPKKSGEEPTSKSNSPAL